jgi:hypothetical protein
MTSSLIYGFSVFTGLYNVITLIGILIVIACLAISIFAFIENSEHVFKDEVLITLKKWAKRTGIISAIFIILAIFVPSPKTVAMMYGVDYLHQLNTNAEVTTTQLYKDITTIIHNYAAGNKEK